ncbi:MAG TPA: hypothetical protein VN888_07550 [Mycobacterium sp.]|nr:hypothetical protein [Mycobacterium sp.]
MPSPCHLSALWPRIPPARLKFDHRPPRLDRRRQSPRHANTCGLVKFVADAQTDHILGCHIAGPDAGDLVHEAVIAMTCGATYTQLASAIHIHPTLAEGSTPPPAASAAKSAPLAPVDLTR